MVVRSLSGLGLSDSFYFVLEFGKFELEFLFLKISLKIETTN